MTTDTAAEIILTHRIVWRYRNELERVWPTPHRIDCYRFAFTEAGEALDAELRKVPIYARNNDRNMSVPEELADCAMMLCSALPPNYRFDFFTPVTATTLDGICYEVAYSLIAGEGITALCMIEKHLMTNYSARMSVLVEQRLQRIARKVLPA